MRISILSMTPTSYNRQLADMVWALNDVGEDCEAFVSTPCRMDNDRIHCVPYLCPKGFFSSLHVFINALRAFGQSAFRRCDILVIMYDHFLLFAWFFKIFYGAKVVRYSLESAYPMIFRKLSWLIDAYVDVEPNRLKKVQETGGMKPGFVLYNVPHKVDFDRVTPKLRAKLQRDGRIGKDDKLVVFAGSYQSYSNLENIIDWSDEFPLHVKLVIMGAGFDGRWKEAAHPNLILLSLVNGREFYDYFVDADVGLLPYESDDFNVRFCSPQKLFDCVALGVPILGSKRPLVQEVVDEIGIGITVDLTNKTEFLEGVQEVLKCTSANRAQIRTFHAEYNYEKFTFFLQDFLAGI